MSDNKLVQLPFIFPWQVIHVLCRVDGRMGLIWFLSLSRIHALFQDPASKTTPGWTCCLSGVEFSAEESRSGAMAYWNKPASRREILNPSLLEICLFPYVDNLYNPACRVFQQFSWPLWPWFSTCETQVFPIPMQKKDNKNNSNIGQTKQICASVRVMFR